MIDRRNFLKAASAVPVAGFMPNGEAKPKVCPHEWEIMENVNSGIFNTRYIGPDVVDMPKVMVKQTYVKLILCHECGEYYNKIISDIYCANDAFKFSKTIAGYNILEHGGSWVALATNHDVIEVEGRTYRPDFDKNTDTVHYIGGHKPTEVTLEIIKTEYNIRREYGRDYYNIVCHECLVVENGKTKKFSPCRPLKTTLPTYPKHLCDAKETDFTGEFHKATFPKWWINQT